MGLLMDIVHHSARLEEVVGAMEFGCARHENFITSGGSSNICLRRLKVDFLGLLVRKLKYAILVVLFYFFLQKLSVFPIACHIFPCKELLGLILQRFH